MDPMVKFAMEAIFGKSEIKKTDNESADIIDEKVRNTITEEDRDKLVENLFGKRKTDGDRKEKEETVVDIVKSVISEVL